MLEIVEDEQHLLVSQGRLHLFCQCGVRLLTQAQRLGDYTGNERRVADGSQIREDHTIGEGCAEVLRDLERKSRLPDAARSRQGEQASMIPPVGVQQCQGAGAIRFAAN
jgi:hypothetical protein